MSRTDILFAGHIKPFVLFQLAIELDQIRSVHIYLGFFSYRIFFTSCDVNVPNKGENNHRMRNEEIEQNNLSFVIFVSFVI
jgi:hypothetical protein